MEFTIPVPLGAQASLLANTPVRKPPDSSKVETAPDAGKARSDMHNSHKQSPPLNGRETVARRLADEEIRPDTLAGPPPSFQVNVLEMDQRLQQKLARIETVRAQGKNADRPLDEPPNNDSPNDVQNPEKSAVLGD